MCGQENFEENRKKHRAERTNYIFGVGSNASIVATRIIAAHTFYTDTDFNYFTTQQTFFA